MKIHGDSWDSSGQKQPGSWVTGLMFSRTPSPPLRRSPPSYSWGGLTKKPEWEIGNPVMMQREMWAMDTAKDASQLPGGYFGGDIYSAHPNDSTGTWRGDAAVISQIDAMALAKK